LDGKAKFEYFSLDDSLGSGFDLKTGSAYLIIQNNHGTGMTLYDGLSIVTTSTGGQAINPNRALTFQIDMPKKPGSNDEYVDSVTKAQFKIGNPAQDKQVPSFEYKTDTIYQIDVSGTNPYDINFSDIKEVGTMTFGN